MTEIDLHIMKSLIVHIPATDVVANNSTSSTSGEVQSVQVNFNEIKISPVPEKKNETTDGVEPMQMDLAVRPQQAVIPAAPDEEEPAPSLPWLYGSPSQEVLDRCNYIKIQSQQLKYITYDNTTLL